MSKITIRETQNPTILKFEFQDFITENESFEFFTNLLKLFSTNTYI